nr:hypothetical protein [Tanacetum cinerariifolium]
MKMEQYLAHIDYALWEVILNGNGSVQITKDEVGNEIKVPPITAQQILARTREKKAKSTLLMAIPNEHLARFHRIKDAKTLWAAIKTRFSEGLDKGYDRFQRLLSLLEIHREQAYNNLKVYEADIKGSSGSSPNSQNVAFVSAESTSSTNDFNAAYSVSTATCHCSQAQGSSSYADELMKTGRKLEFNGKEPVGFDKTKVECFDYHRRGHFARDCRTAKNSGNKSKDPKNVGYRGRDNDKRPTKEEDEKALVVQDGLGYDSQFNEKEMLDVKEKEVTETVFDNLSSDEENSLANDRFKKGEGYHAVPPPLTGNYMPPKPNLSFAGLDDSIYKFKISETVTGLAKDEKDALETSTVCVENLKKDRSSALFIQDWDTDNDNDSGFRPKHIPAKIDFVKAGYFWRPRVNKIDQIPKENRWIYTRVDYGYPQQALKNKGIADSECSRHMIGNKAYLANYQKINDGGFVAFGSSRGKITSKAPLLVASEYTRILVLPPLGSDPSGLA